MNKNELIEAIQQVITPNGQKGITAESLANLLIEMVNATPEGGSGGSGQIVFYAGMPTGETDEFLAMSEFEPTPEQKAHNVEMFKLFKETYPCCSVSIDASEFYKDTNAEDMAGDFDVKYNLAGVMVVYIPSEAFPELGQDAIMVNGMFESFILEDGTVRMDI